MRGLAMFLKGREGREGEKTYLVHEFFAPPRRETRVFRGSKFAVFILGVCTNTG